MSDATPRFEGQIALVTGATRGIGRAIALELAARGVTVVGTATTEAGAASITQALAAVAGAGAGALQGQGSHGICLNVTDAAALDAAIDGIVKQHGALHILVNNAGITRDMLAMRLKDEDWDAVIDTNLKAVFRASRAV
ncbi:MAG: SDR family NAD(P)-dependent oxidoreductase, partial [Betaproteobacteria bacterium]